MCAADVCRWHMALDPDLAAVAQVPETSLLDQAASHHIHFGWVLAKTLFHIESPICHLRVNLSFVTLPTRKFFPPNEHHSQDILLRDQRMDKLLMVQLNGVTYLEWAELQ